MFETFERQPLDGDVRLSRHHVNVLKVYIDVIHLKQPNLMDATGLVE